MHYPYNNTPYNILSSMRVNDSAYCPASALAAAGCITFVASGSGHGWPFFLTLLANGLGASVVPCGVFSFHGAGLPGFSTSASGGDGSCLLPGGARSTTSASFQSFLASSSTGGNSSYWDSVQLRALNAPNADPWPRGNLMGSGPYYAVAPSWASGYTPHASPAYVEPSGCSGARSYIYVGYCEPAPGSYIPQVNVTYDPNDSASISGFTVGTIDVGQIQAPDTVSSLLPLVNQSKVQYTVAHSLFNSALAFNFDWNSSLFNATFGAGAVPSVPDGFFSNSTARQFFVHAFPYANVSNSLLSVGGVPYSFYACGPIPQGVPGYASNLTADGNCPQGNPDPNAGDLGGAAWWWAQGTNVSSPYYDPAMANCTASVPCGLPLLGEPADPALSAAQPLWIGDIEAHRRCPATVRGHRPEPAAGRQLHYPRDRLRRTSRGVVGVPGPGQPRRWLRGSEQPLS